MIRYEITNRQEEQLRIGYVNSSEFDYNDYLGYHQYVMKNVPGAVEASYRGGDDPNWVDVIVFAEEKHLAWFILRYA